MSDEQRKSRNDALRKQLEHLKNAIGDVKRYGASEVLSDGPEGYQTHDTAVGWLQRIAADTVPMIEALLSENTPTTVWGPERQDYPVGPVYRIGTSTGATLPPQPEAPRSAGVLTFEQWIATHPSITDVTFARFVWEAARSGLPSATVRICPYCTSDNRAIRDTYYDQNCEGCVKRMGATDRNTDKA